jgi:hypothetical protein
MSIEVMKQALELLEDLQGGCTDSDDGTVEALTIHCPEVIANLRSAIEQAKKPVAWMHVQGNYKQPSLYQLDDFELDRKWNQYPLYTAPRQEHYDQTSLELCKECGWRAIIPGDGCLVCARQKAKPVAWRWKALVNGEFVSNWVLTHSDPPSYATESMPLYTAPPPRYRRGTYVRCMESDELCRVYTTSIDGGAWIRWPDGSITTYTAEQMGQAFSLEQAAPGNTEWVGLTDEEIVQAMYKADEMAVGSTQMNFARVVEAKLKEKNRDQ